MKSSRLRGLRLIGSIAAIALVVGCQKSGPDDLIASGQAHLESGKAKDAAVELRQALANQPGSSRARMLFGRALFEIGDPASAAVEYRKAMEGGEPKASVVPALTKAMVAAGDFKKVVEEFGGLSLGSPAADAELDVAVATSHLAMGDFNRAQTRLDAALQRQPQLASAFILKARMKLRDNQIDEAVKLLDDVLAREPKNVDARMLLGDVKLSARKDTEGALAEYRKVVEIKPDSVAAHSALIQAALRAEHYDEARAQLAKLKAASPLNPQTRYFDAQIALLDKNYERARDLVQSLLKIAPNNTNVNVLGGLVELKLGNQRQAIAHFTKVLADSPGRTDIRRTLAAQYLRIGQTDKALAVLKSEIAKEPGDGTSLALAGQALLQQGDFAQARAMFQRASKLMPMDAAVGTSIAIAALAAGDEAVALHQLQQLAATQAETYADETLIALRMQQHDFQGAMAAIDRLEQKKGVDPALPAFLRGKVEIERGDGQAARRQFEAALSKKPTDYRSVESLVRLDLGEFKIADAQRRLDALLNLDPKNASALIELARIRSIAGADKAEITARLGEAMRADPKDTRVPLHLIDYLLSKYDAKGAAAAAQNALAVQEESEDLLLRLGRAFSAGGDSQQAIGTYRRLIQVKPKSSEAYLRLAEVYASVNKNAEAEQVLRQAATVFPQSQSVYKALIDRLLKTRKPDEALAVAKSVQRQFPKYALGFMLESEVHALGKRLDASLAALRAGLATQDASEVAVRLHDVLRLSGRTREAQAFASEWAKTHLRDLATLRSMADAAMRGRDYVAADGLYRQILQADPKNGGALNNMAWIAYKSGKPDAVEFAQRAVAAEPWNSSFLDTLAYALLSAKQTARAVETEKQAAGSPTANSSLRLSAAALFIAAGQMDLATAELDKLGAASDKSFVKAEVDRLRQMIKR